MNVFPLKVYGERNTGTNYLFHLLEKNLDVSLLRPIAPRWITLPARAIRQFNKITPQSCLRMHEHLIDLYFKITFSSNLGWKHCLVDCSLIKEVANNLEVKFVTVTKNPYSWILSMYNRPHHGVGSICRHEIPFEIFLRQNWITVGRELSPLFFENPIILWNKKNRAYAELARQCPTLNLRYEDILESPEKILSRIEGFCGAPRKKIVFQNQEEDAKGHGKNYEFYRNFHLNEEWRKKLSPDGIKIINSYLDPEMMKYFRYDVL